MQDSAAGAVGIVVEYYVSWQEGNYCMQLEGVKVDEETQQAIEDWRYWVNRGYEF